VRDIYYGDKRDLIKWGVLLRLAGTTDAQRILQVAYYRPSNFSPIIIDGEPNDVPKEVLAHFRDLRSIGSIVSRPRVTVFDQLFEDRDAYLQEVVALVSAMAHERCLVFLDPDTGLEPKSKPGLQHVLGREARAIWETMKRDDLFVFYQHQTNRTGLPWIEKKREQLTGALGVRLDVVKTAQAPGIARDVVFFYAQRE